MEGFISNLSEEGARVLGADHYLMGCDKDTIDEVSNKWHDAMTNLVYRDASIQTTSASLWSTYKAWSSALHEGSAGPANNGP